MPTVLLVKHLESGEVEEKKLEVEEGEVVFDQLDQKGETLPHGCLAGSCGSCRINVIEGAESLKEPSAVEQDTLKTICETYREKYGEDFLKDKNIRLSCRARILGDIKITPIKA
jgi:ferredoxin